VDGRAYYEECAGGRGHRWLALLTGPVFGFGLGMWRRQGVDGAQVPLDSRQHLG
jgi:hypothetical protein